MIIVTNEKTKKDVLELTPFMESYSCTAGGRRHEVKVTTTLVDGGCIELDQEINDKSGDSIVPDFRHEALPVFRQIATLPPVQYLTVFGEYSSSLEDEHDYQFGKGQFGDGLPQLRPGERYEIIIPLQRYLYIR